MLIYNKLKKKGLKIILMIKKLKENKSMKITSFLE
jgi:hypothetical protein